MEGDPLRETLDELLPADTPAGAGASARPRPSTPAVDAVCRALADEPGIADVRLGRQVHAGGTDESCAGADAVAVFKELF